MAAASVGWPKLFSSPKSPTWSPDGSQIISEHGLWRASGCHPQMQRQRPPRNATNVEKKSRERVINLYCFDLPPTPAGGLAAGQRRYRASLKTCNYDTKLHLAYLAIQPTPGGWSTRWANEGWSV